MLLTELAGVGVVGAVEAACEDKEAGGPCAVRGRRSAQASHVAFVSGRVGKVGWGGERCGGRWQWWWMVRNNK